MAEPEVGAAATPSPEELQEPQDTPVALRTVIASRKEVERRRLLKEHATVGSKHFSGVENGEKFIFELELDPQLYEQPSVSVTMERDEKTGLSVCQAPGCRTRPWEHGKRVGFLFAAMHVKSNHCPPKNSVIKCGKNTDGSVKTRRLKSRTITGMFGKRVSRDEFIASQFGKKRQKTLVPLCQPVASSQTVPAATSVELPSLAPVCAPTQPASSAETAPMEIEAVHHEMLDIAVIESGIARQQDTDCPGYMLKLAGPAAEHYLFALHSGKDKHLLEWEWPRGDGAVQALDCKGDRRCKKGPCFQCQKLKHSSHLARLITRTFDQNSHVAPYNHLFLGHAAMTKRSNHHRDQGSLTRVLLWRHGQALKKLRAVFLILCPHTLSSSPPHIAVSSHTYHGCIIVCGQGWHVWMSFASNGDKSV